MIANQVWIALGDVRNYVEPFFASGAVFFARPHPHKIATLNDLDAFISNFWRAVQSSPEEVAKYVNWPVFENDLHARHLWLVRQAGRLQKRLEGDPDYYDAKIAGWWCWGMCCWIADGFCTGEGPWTEVNGELVKKNSKVGIYRKMPNLGAGGTGVNRVTMSNIYSYLSKFTELLGQAQVCCGNWDRVCGPFVTFKHGLTGVFLDPPYSDEANQNMKYRMDSKDVAHRVREWCIKNGEHPLMRIVLAGYEQEHIVLKEKYGWRMVPWKARGGYGSFGKKSQANENCYLERLFLSPNCLDERRGMFW